MKSTGMSLKGFQSLEWGRLLVSRHALKCSLIVLLLGIGTAIVYITGGTAFSYPYLMLIPVLIAASWYSLAGGLITALAAGILMAFMPLDTMLGSDQSTFNYLLRIVLYLLLGGVAGWLFQSRRNAFASHREVSRTDLHSGLFNQVALNEDLLECLSRPEVAAGKTGVIKVKITDMADVIEALGLKAADDLVVTLSQRLSEVLRRGSQTYRISPDELALVVPDIEATDLDIISHRLMEVGEESFLVQEVPVRVQLAMGSSITSEDKTTEEILREARIALLTSVRKRREFTHFDPVLDQRSLDSFKLIARVRDGLAAREFELFYQPKIRLADGQVCGCEGLIRWRGDNGKLIPPGQFMPKVESTSLIGPLTYFVIQAAGAFSRNPGCESVVSINISVHNLYDEKLHDLLVDLVKKANVSPERLEVEITESAFVGDIESARDAIQRIRDLGFGVSIDDFGTGFASFEYLKHLPITGLKIDRTFVANLGSDTQARKLMGCMIDIGHALGLVVTAEGVETLQQEAVLRELGCDQAQGFVYSPALPAKEYFALYKNNKRYT
ncbi:GGDEF domain-containing phosphodiesterase [Halomonas sp. LR5S13]|uniref:putative bifunctional diguanylate cyclase/phosphodiesterase n=1 Tax=Halomonas rhizosphaerae TaxID=3043296 RepID=UPI0024A8395F|nr:GGDEF domain-containing phosphodiesterase [Halomonas rhizosphaerae]MDI5920434.1 GGDEF domain-containing phosphodiesterase [Halomonas rhizosphaerae]